MVGSVAEGISTSLQTCPSDPQGRSVSKDLPSFPSIPVHVNDLGLTPPPGSQQLQQRNSTQGFSQDETRDMSAADAEKSSSVACPDVSSVAVDTSFPSDICPVGYNDSSDLMDGFMDGFDPEAALRELHAALDSRKRTGDEAFPEGVDFWNSPEKKRLLEFTHTSVGSPPGDTPSLSSPDSLLRPEQMESAPHTPAASGTIQSPSSLFDSLDALFEDPHFQVPLEVPADEIPAQQLDFDLPEASEMSIPKDAIDGFDQILSPGEPVSAKDPPSISELTKQRFGLSAEDLIASTTRETLKLHTEPQYTTPYPVYGGPLGYFPSAPGIHIKCVEVTDDDVHNRMDGLKTKVQQLTHERNKYRTAWNKWTTVDQATGKSKEQLLREENTRLVRKSSQLQSKVDQYKDEALEWKNRLSELSVIYNNLLYDIHVRRQMPAIAPVPEGYQPTSVAGSQGHTYALHPPAAPVGPTQPIAGRVAPPAPAHAGAPNGSVTTPSVPPPANAGSKAAPVMIDLTDESSEQNDPQPTSESESSGANMIQSLRNKKYDWLQPSTQSGTVSAPSSPHHQASRSPDRSRSQPPNLSDEDLARAMELELAST